MLIPNNFEFSTLELCDINELVIKEQYYIDLLKPEYNISKTAGTTKGIRHTIKWRKEHSIRMSGSGNPNFRKPMSLEQRVKLTNRKRSKETIERIRAAQIKRPVEGIHYLTGEVLEFDLVIGTKNAGFDPSHVCKSIRKGYKHKNFYWQYL